MGSHTPHKCFRTYFYSAAASPDGLRCFRRMEWERGYNSVCRSFLDSNAQTGPVLPELRFLFLFARFLQLTLRRHCIDSRLVKIALCFRLSRSSSWLPRLFGPFTRSAGGRTLEYKTEAG